VRIFLIATRHCSPAARMAASKQDSHHEVGQQAGPHRDGRKWRRQMLSASWWAKAHHPRLAVLVPTKAWIAGLRPP